MLEKFVRLISSVFVMGLVAKSLGAEDFGRLTMFIVLASLGGTVIKAGSDIVLLSILSNRNNRFRSLFVVSTIGLRSLLLLVYVSIFFILFPAAYFAEAQADVLVRSLILYLIYHLVSVFEVYFQSTHRVGIVLLNQSIFVILFAAIKYLAVIKNEGVNTFILLHAFEAAFTGLILTLIYIYKTQYNIILRESVKIFGFMKIIIFRSFPIFVASFFIMIYTKLDQVMLGWLAGSLELGLYAAAFRLVDPFSFLVVSLATLYIPSMSGNIPDDKKNKLKVEFFEWVILLAGLVFIVILLFSRIFIENIYGNEFMGANNIVFLLSISTIFSFCGVALMRVSVAENIHGGIAKRVIGACVINVCLNFILIPKYGAVGAAIASAVAQFFASIIGFYECRTRHLLMEFARAFEFKGIRGRIARL